jgi:H+-transporting ATPase
MYLKVSISDFLTLFSARTHDGFFWSSTPSPILLIAAGISLTLSTLLACFWPTSYVDEQYVVGLADRAPKAMAVYVWLYCIFWWFVQDTAKVVLYWWMEKYNILGINDSSHVNATMAAAETAGSKTSSNPLHDEDKGNSLKRSLLH